MLIAIAATLLAAPAVDASTFIVTGHQNLMSRMDPIINPGVVGDHVHSFLGASNVREVLNTPEEQDRASCTSVNVAADKSSYWTPTVYYIHENGTFSALGGNTRAYYKNFKKNTQPFPKGLRMVTGTAMSRDLNDTRTKGNLLGCSGNMQPYLPNKNWEWDTCGWGNSLELAASFPSCGWANQSLDSWDHFSHMAWPLDTDHGMYINPSGGGGGTCPESHPIEYPVISLVTFYQLGDLWKKGRDNVVFSNGDLEGSSYHADFISGWDEDVLRAALNDPACDVGPEVQNCPAFKPSYQGKAAHNGMGVDEGDIGNWAANIQCAYQGQIPNEDVGLYLPIDKLPGCNPLWHPGVTEKPTCPNQPADPGWVSANAWKSGSTPNFPFVLKDNVPGLYNRYDGSYHGRARFGPWGELGRNNDTIMVSQEPWINGWLPNDPNESPINQVKNIKDTCAWKGIVPGDKTCGEREAQPKLSDASGKPPSAAVPAGSSSTPASSSTSASSSATPASSATGSSTPLASSSAQFVNSNNGTAQDANATIPEAGGVLAAPPPAATTPSTDGSSSPVSPNANLNASAPPVAGGSSTPPVGDSAPPAATPHSATPPEATPLSNATPSGNVSSPNSNPGTPVKPPKKCKPKGKRSRSRRTPML